MNKPLSLVLIAATLAFTASAAMAGQITTASGPITVNGKAVRIEAGSPLTLNEGDVLDTQAATVTWKSAAGDEISLEPGTIARGDGTDAEADYLFLKTGAATGTLSSATLVGVTAGWMTAAADEKANVFLEATPERAGGEGTFRAISGGAWVQFAGFRTWIPAQHTVTLSVDPDDTESLCYRTAQQNPSEVEVHKVLGAGEVRVYVPKASSGCIQPAEDGSKTKISNDITSLKTAKTRIETRFSGRAPQRAELGPGTYALIDNATGTIEVVFEAVEFVILDRAISLTSEFATLAQSNYSDVLSDNTTGIDGTKQPTLGRISR